MRLELKSSCEKGKSQHSAESHGQGRPQEIFQGGVRSFEPTDERACTDHMLSMEACKISNGGQLNYARLYCAQNEACSKRRILHAPNAFKTMDNEAFQLIIYCFECIRHM